MRFIKFHGFGNDYIVFEAGQLALVGSLNDFARRVCERHYGAGADGIALVQKSTGHDADFDVRIFNVDGSEAGLSGNGTRAAAAYLYYRGLWSGNELRLATRTGVKLYRLLERLSEGHYWFASELGQPAFDSASIPILTDEPLERVVDYPLSVEGASVLVTALLMGNPMCCIFVEDFDAIDWRRLGRLLEVHPQFPERANVVFVRVHDRGNIELRIWERGVGETSASGTCSCAAAVASVMKGLTERRLRVSMPGGKIAIEWREDGEVLLTGRADIVYGGEWLAGANAPETPQE
ncbi:MAG TPA: diaminopimelate epimerase [Pyrinomonadaceae bacterium]|jgi:diaminopimelate epimerase|nr:diaminopimelate epimerase [Pyrinomonadaceae bacterium]